MNLRHLFTADQVAELEALAGQASPDRQPTRRLAVVVYELTRPDYTGGLDADVEAALSDAEGCGCCRGNTSTRVVEAAWLDAAAPPDPRS